MDFRFILLGMGGLALFVASGFVSAETTHVISDKTQAAIWRSQAKINSLNAQLNAEIEVLKKAAQQASAECGDGYHMEQNQKEDLICAANKDSK